MASVNLQSKDGYGDGSRSPERARAVSAPWNKIVSGESCESSSPVVSVISPAASPPPLSIQEQIMNASTDWYPPDTASSVDECSIGCQPDGSDIGGGGTNVIKKPVWSKPSNGVVEVVSPVMGAVSWPALGESTKSAPKSSSSESLHTLSDGSLLPAVQETGNKEQTSRKPASVNPASTPNHVTHSGQRLVKRGGGSSGTYISSNGGVSKSELLHDTSGKPDTIATDSIPKDHTYKESSRGGFGSQPNSGSDHHHQQNSYRRGNGGQNFRAQGQGQGRGNQVWSQHRNFNRDMNTQPQRGGFHRGGYVRPSVHNSTPFIHPPMPLPVRPFGNNVMYPDVASAMIYFQGPAAPMVPGPRYFPFPDPLHGNIVKQIEYYFSNENLVKDTYFRRNMDEQGWVPVNLIASFNKVSSLTDNLQLILDVMRQSTVVEVQGEKMRRRNDWMRWLMPPAVQVPLASQLQGIGLDSRPSSGELSSQLPQGGGERAAVA
ncbi:hypothetical protein L1987_18365 [Smallanthus sonchifolius]|uniref:Uncharacterized protein n=1 Tax=Smallanthus sonchifolius TaxID=185202 RepID=A0ACB9J0J8_9ASTR|nr:hypothetical protein L1987_18365 [Smallanthus sonchifolius]